MIAGAGPGTGKSHPLIVVPSRVLHSKFSCRDEGREPMAAGS